MGRPLDFRLTGGQASDIRQALPLLAGKLLPRHFIADKAYDADSLVDWLEFWDVEVVIPPNRTRLYQRPYNRQRYRQRNRIERFINRLKHNRRIATRYEKTAKSFAALILLAFIRFWLNF